MKKKKKAKNKLPQKKESKPRLKFGPDYFGLMMAVFDKSPD